MENKSLVEDYLQRAKDRVLALDLFLAKKSWANAVRESQEVVELVLKALLRACNFEIPRVHDVSNILEENRSKLPESIRKQLPKLTKISKNLRRDRELSFYGSEDLTPNQFYSMADAEAAVEGAKVVLTAVLKGLSR